MSSSVDLFFRYYEAFLGGILVTAKLAGIVWVSGLAFGTLLGVVAANNKRFTGVLLKVAAAVAAAVPILLALFWFRYPFQMISGVTVQPFVSAAFTLSLVNVLMVGDSVRRAITEFPRHYVWAALVCGIPRSRIPFRIQAPLLLRRTLPDLINMQVIMLQATLLASFVSVDEIFMVARQIDSFAYKPVEIYTTLAVLFLLICAPLNAVAHQLRKRFPRDYSEW